MRANKMKTAKITNEANGSVIAESCHIAVSMIDCMIGLMGMPKLDAGKGLLIMNHNSIHTFFMKFAIDAVYMNKEGKVLKVSRDLAPWRMDMPVFGATQILEVPSGAAKNVNKGERLCIS